MFFFLFFIFFLVSDYLFLSVSLFEIVRSRKKPFLRTRVSLVVRFFISFLILNDFLWVSMGFVAKTRSPSPTLQTGHSTPSDESKRILQISILKPTVVVVAPSHPSLQSGPVKKKVPIRHCVFLTTFPCELRVVVLCFKVFHTELLSRSRPTYSRRICRV